MNVTGPLTGAEARVLAGRSTRYGFFRPAPGQTWVQCPAGCGRRVESVLDRYAVDIERSMKMTARGWEGEELRQLRERVRAHLVEDCTVAAPAAADGGGS